RALLPAAGHRRPHLPSLPDPGRCHALLPDRLQRPDGRPGLSREEVRPRIRHGELGQGQSGQGPGSWEREVTATSTGADHLVRALNVTKSFGTNEVLKGVDLTVDPREVVCLLGPSGSGKTTFLRLINQMESLTGGRI